MTGATVTVDVHQLLDVGGNGAAKIAFDMVVRFEFLTQSRDLILGQILRAGIGVNPGFRENLFGTGQTDALNIGESDLNALFIGDIDSC